MLELAAGAVTLNVLEQVCESTLEGAIEVAGNEEGEARQV